MVEGTKVMFISPMKYYGTKGTINKVVYKGGKAFTHEVRLDVEEEGQRILMASQHELMAI